MASNEIEPRDLAVVGLDAAWGGCAGPDSTGGVAFERMIYAGGQVFAQPGARLLKGQVEDWLQQSARRALADAGLLEMPARIAALFTCGKGAAPRFDFAGSSTDLSEAANPLVSALLSARSLFEQGQADAVVFAASSPYELDWRDIPLAESSAMGLNRSAHGWRIGSGAGAIVLMPYGQAQAARRRIYAVIRSMAWNEARLSPNGFLPVAPALEDVRAAVRLALERAGVGAAEVGYVETFASGVDALDGVEIAGLCQGYKNGAQSLLTAFGSAQGNVGNLGAASGLAGLVRAALCLYHRILPAVPGWSAPKLPALWKVSPFYAPLESKSWFVSANGPGRMAGLDVLGRMGSFAHLVLSEDPQQKERPNLALSKGGFYLFPLAGLSLDDLNEQLEDLRSALTYAPDLPHAVAESYRAIADRADEPYGLAIIGHSHDELLREIDLAIKSIPAAFEKGGEWQTPLGSCFTAQPVGKLGQVALVYPGAFNSYPGVAKDLFHLFPFLFNRSVGRTSDLGRVVRDTLLYPRSLVAPTKEAQAAYEAGLLGDPVAMLTSGTTVAILFTYILEEAFKIPISSAFGYSLGENSMMYATRIWVEGDEATAKVEKSPVFLKQLAGPQNAIRASWGLPLQETAGEASLWHNYILMAPWEAVQPVLAQEPRAYLTHINAPRQVVIGGDPLACQRVIAALRCASLQAPFDYALHCAPMRSEYAGLADMHNWPIERIPPMQLYSAADYRPLDLKLGVEGGREVSEKIAHMLTSPLDFPRLVNAVYADGARVFIEAGAGSNCTRWVDESLKGRPHVALSINRRGTDDYTSLVRLLAKLHSHRVPLDLSALYISLQEMVTL